MRKKYGDLRITIVLLSVLTLAASQENIPKPTVSDQALSKENVAVYQAVLRDYLKGSNKGLNLGNLTDRLDPADASCLKSIDQEKARSEHTIVHRLEPSFFVGMKIVLVDAKQQGRVITENDPQNLMKKAIDNHAKVTDKQVDQSVKQAFQAGLFTVSEIIFDKEHQNAVVSYSFVCGSLCGSGNTLTLTKAGKEWKVAKRCGGWIS